MSETEKETTQPTGLHDLSFRELREVSGTRCRRWHPGGLEGWSLSEWFLATLGELGEAANKAKKLNRLRDGIAGNSAEETEAALLASIADELADTAIYLDLTAARLGVDLGAAIARKFNATSSKVGLPERLREQTQSGPTCGPNRYWDNLDNLGHCLEFPGYGDTPAEALAGFDLYRVCAIREAGPVVFAFRAQRLDAEGLDEETLVFGTEEDAKRAALHRAAEVAEGLRRRLGQLEP